MKKEIVTSPVNLGLFMRTAVEGAIGIAQAEAASYERIAKIHYNGLDADLVTSADLKAQAHYEALVKTHFPNEGLVGEENNLGGTNNESIRFTVDPIDGTKAYGRNQSTGVSTMFAHANGEEVDAVCIGDVNTNEIYQFAPGHIPTRTRFGHTTPLPTTWAESLGSKYVLLNHPAEDYPVNIQKIIRRKHGGIFKDMEVSSGSIGVMTARIWKGEVAMLVLYTGYNTPWDSTPIIGMNRALGIAHIAVDQETGKATVFEPMLPLATTKKDFIEILVHKTYVDEVIAWLNTNRQ